MAELKMWLNVRNAKGLSGVQATLNERKEMSKKPLEQFSKGFFIHAVYLQER
jgi:hypothetical protein